MTQSNNAAYRDLLRRPVVVNNKHASVPTKRGGEASDPKDPDTVKYQELLRKVQRSRESSRLKP
jgi:hypothetical protein